MNTNTEAAGDRGHRLYADQESLRSELCSEPFVTAGRLRPLLPFGRTKFYELVKSETFPEPIDLGAGESGDLIWWSCEVADYLTSRPRRSELAPEAATLSGPSVAIATTPRRRGDKRRSVAANQSLTDNGEAVVVARQRGMRRDAA